MPKLVSPKVFLVGFSELDVGGLVEYLRHTKQEEFLDDVAAARDAGLSGGEIMCSTFAKLCYRSLVVGKNANITRTRAVRANLESCHDTGHGSVFEHCGLNFIVTDCSRVFTHELVRHRAGTAFSQTSGRYCRLDEIALVWDPVLDPVKELFLDHVERTEDVVYMAECKLGLRKPPPLPDQPAMRDLVTSDPGFYMGCRPSAWPNRDALKWVPDDSFDFDKRKAITSAIRRIAPNGQSNEIAFTVNIRALRHMVQLRTARFAEYEIRDVFAQVYHLVAARFPTVFYRAKTRLVNGLPEITGMRATPYEISADDPKALQHWLTPALVAELATRQDGKDS